MPSDSLNEITPAASGDAASLTEDRELLRAYVEDGASDAFSDLVARHVNWVYSAALRRTGNHATARRTSFIG
jgi:hypothetical protein